MLIGRLGKDPEVKNVNDSTVAEFPLATDEYFTDRKGEKQERTTWHNIIAWGQLATLSRDYIKKGQQIYVEGRQINRSYQDKEGQTKWRSEVVADNIRLLGSKSENSSESREPDTQYQSGGRAQQEKKGSQAESPRVSEADGYQNDDDLPF